MKEAAVTRLNISFNSVRFLDLGGINKLVTNQMTSLSSFFPDATRFQSSSSIKTEPKENRTKVLLILCQYCPGRHKPNPLP